MKLTQFRVRDFRSVRDSGWIEVGAVTSLIGTNESGKTNLLVPLWKLNPAKDGEIDPIADYPRSRYAAIRDAEKKPTFIQARFELDDTLAQQLATKTGARAGELKVAEVSRNYSGKYQLEFPEAVSERSQTPGDTKWTITYWRQQLAKLSSSDEEASLLKKRIEQAMCDAEALVPSVNHDSAALEKVVAAITTAISVEELGTDLGKPAQNAVNTLRTRAANLTTDIGDCEGIWKSIRDAMPKFVYYSNYGNLDGEIYLPRVIEDMKRTNLGPKEQARTRTLKVLFNFVRLSPSEILELGQDPPTDSPPEKIEEFARRKEERDILLDSASAQLTKAFREWWQQGEYIFSLRADGDFFKVWVSDKLRPEPVALEGRSTGLQWFLSFFLIFLVEAKDAHSNSVILLDEPGHSLHPLAQRDLFRFFENLATTNQLVYTTHSPFLVNPDHLDFVRVVYVNDVGETAVSADLRAGTNPKQTTNSIYPVHAALGLSVSETLLQGCQPIIVEGVSDLIYLSAIKTLLVRKKKIAPKCELVFIPCGGAKGASTVASILMGRDQELPFVLFDSDSVGNSAATDLKSKLYVRQPKRVLQMGDLLDMPKAEIEDVLPSDLMAREVARLLPRTDEDFDYSFDRCSPFVPQVAAFADKNDIPLLPGWKVDLALKVKARLLAQGDEFLKDDAIVAKWLAVFLAIRE